MNLVEELRSKKSRDNRDLLDRAADRIEELELLLNQNKSNNFDVKSNKQFKEIKSMLEHNPYVPMYQDKADIFAQYLYNEGYRKQSEGEWVPSDIPQEKYVCSVCGGACWYYDFEGDVAKSRYCPNCGSKMKGGAAE